MSSASNEVKHCEELSVEDAVEVLVGYFMGEACRGCAIQAVEYLHERLMQDAWETERARTQGIIGEKGN